MVSPPSGAAKKRDLPVHPLPVREQTVPDGDAPGVDRAEPVCRRHGPLVQYSGQLYPFRMVLI
jgi:hypothetical protein